MIDDSVEGINVLVAAIQYSVERQSVVVGIKYLQNALAVLPVIQFHYTTSVLLETHQLERIIK
jgi:hypothetical protein